MVCRLYLRPGRMLRAKKVFQAPRPVYVCPTLVHLEHVGRTVLFLEGCFAEGDISRHRARSTFVLR